MQGWDLVGLYWCIIGMMHEQGGYLNNDIDSLAFALRTNNERITLLLRSDLFKIDDNKITSDRVLLNLFEMKKRSHKARESIQSRWNKEVIEDTNVLRTNNDSNTKKRKEKKRKDILKARPTIDEIRAYCTEIKSPIDPDNFFHTYESQNWIKANGLPVLNWKSTIRTWENRKKKEGNANGPDTRRML